MELLDIEFISALGIATAENLSMLRLATYGAACAVAFVVFTFLAWTTTGMRWTMAMWWILHYVAVPFAFLGLSYVT